jgi:hypothetical protein
MQAIADVPCGITKSRAGEWSATTLLKTDGIPSQARDLEQEAI